MAAAQLRSSVSRRWERANFTLPQKCETRPFPSSHEADFIVSRTTRPTTLALFRSTNRVTVLAHLAGPVTSAREFGSNSNR
jgi:hypothetical protein